jgi:cytochrome c peroxidase
MKFPASRKQQVLAMVGLLGLAGALSASVLPNLFPFRDNAGVVSTYSTGGPIEENGPFFQSLGTNGRECVTCHEPSDAMSITPPHIQERFELTRGNDALFATVDGANCPADPRSARSSHSLLLSHGLIRVGITLPAKPQFTIATVHDPYGCAIVTDPVTKLVTVSIYRRPLPSTNLHFLSTIMFDGRETVQPLTTKTTFAQNLMTDLKQQASDAVLIHAQGAAAPSDAVLTSIVNFELGLYTAQAEDDKAGLLNANGGTGGAYNLSKTNYYPGINDVLGADPNGVAFNPESMNLFSAWTQPEGRGHDSHDDYSNSFRGGFLGGFDRYNSQEQAREDIAAGQKIFTTFPLTISNVRGLNDNAAISSPATIAGTCTTCHDAPNVGDHSLPLPLDIATSHPAAYEHDPDISAALAELDPANVPIFEISGCPNPFDPTDSNPVYTTDPGKALVTGNCSDLNRGKGPILRGLAARAPYFHNGAAADLKQLVNFYNLRFRMNLTDKEKHQLIAFLNSL